MKKYRSIAALLPLLSLFSFFSFFWCHQEYGTQLNQDQSGENRMAVINVFAEVIGFYEGLEGVEVITLEQGKVVGTTDEAGYLRFNYPVGQEMTLMFKKAGFQSSQSATFVVSKEGFRGRHKNISYQAIPHSIFSGLTKLLSFYKSTSLDKDKFQLIATVTAVGKTLNHAPQGVAGAILKAMLNEKSIDQARFYYFATLADKTFPLPYLKKTTIDGGVFCFNLDEGRGSVTAEKEGVRFSTKNINCNLSWWKKHAPGEYPLINLSPPQGPTELK